MKTTLKEKQNRFLDILKGVKRTNEPKLIDFGLKDTNGVLVESYNDFLIESKYVSVCSDKLSVKTFEDVLVYLGDNNVINVLWNNKFLSCKMTVKILDFFIFRKGGLRLVVKSVSYSMVYVLDEEKVRLREIKKIESIVHDCITIKKGKQILCCVTENGCLSVCRLGKDYILRAPIATFPQCDDYTAKRLFSHGQDVYFYRDGSLTNIYSSSDTFAGNEIYNVSGTTVILKKETDKTSLICKVEKYLPQSFDYDSSIQVKVIGNNIVIYNSSKIMFCEVVKNALKLNKKIDHIFTDYSIRSNEILISKNQIRLVFIVRRNESPDTKNFTPKSEPLRRFDYKPFEENSSVSNLTFYNSCMDDLLFKLNLNPPATPNKMEEENITDTSEHTEKSSLSTSQQVISIDTVSHILQNMNTKIDLLWKKIEDERIKNEQDNKLKFKRLLDSISQHLNDKLISTIEATVKNEAKHTNTQIKKLISEQFGMVDATNDACLKKVIDRMENCSINETAPESSVYLKAFKEVLTSKIVPVVESCFEEMRLQMLDELRSSNKVSQHKPITIKDEILGLIQSESINDAAMLAMDCDDDTFLLFVENVTGTQLEGIEFGMQKNLLTKAIFIYGESGQISLTDFICNLLMCLELHCLNTSDLNDLYQILLEIENYDWKKNENVKLIIALQKKQTLKIMKKRK